MARMATATLFDPEIAKKWVLARLGAGRSDGLGLSEDEEEIFISLLDQERPPVIDDERRGHVAGPLEVKEGNDKIDLGKLGEGFYSLPNWVEDDGLQLLSSGAKGILVFEKDAVLRRMTESGALTGLDLLHVSGAGFPNSRVRRFVHRAATQFGLPVYLLADNDTWGYFIYSALKRGTVLPTSEEPHLAAANINFVGVTAADAEQLDERVRIQGKPLWDLRIDAMKRYSCFSSKDWQEELTRFQGHGYKLECEAFAVKDPEFKYLASVIKKRVSAE